jgi:phosphopantetheinyl transferase (holo-ACP synthase)
MLGDDVIDLHDPETAWGAQHPRFDSRVFGVEERAAVAAAPDVESARRIRWSLFAAKEAALKLVRRLDPSTPFVPRRFAVTLGPAGRARVRHGERAIDVAIDERSGALHATATLAGDGPAAVLADVALHDGGARGEGEAARALACERIARRLAVDPARLGIARLGRAPTLLLDGRPLEAALSLSHHGRFVAFGCRLSRPGGLAR